MMFWNLLILVTLFGNNPTKPVAWSFAQASTGNNAINIQFIAKVEEGWHVYATKLANDLGPIPTSFEFKQSIEWEFVGALQEPVAHEEYDMSFAMQVSHHSGTPVFTQTIKRLTNEAFAVHGEIVYMVCNDKTCLPPEVVPFSIEVPAVQ